MATFFIDFSSGVLVTNIGHSHPKHVAAVQAQAAELMNAYDFVTPWRTQLAEKLVQLTSKNLDKAFILSTGAEAVESAIKVARRYTGKYEIISFHGAFHGRTLRVYECRWENRHQERLRTDGTGQLTSTVLLLL
jgi:4-aminobutyrate aminotransferase-like enzyme